MSAANVTTAGRTHSRLLRRPGLVAGLAIIAGIGIVSAAAPLIAPHSPTDQDLLGALRPPSLSHPFGTDVLGRDILSRVIYGGRYEIEVALPAIIAAMVIALPFGLLAGYRRGWPDRVISLLSDSILTFPGMVLAIVLVAILGAGLFPLVVTIVVTQTPQMVRYVRGFTSQVAAADYVLASRATGSRQTVTLARHVVPNIAGPIVVIMSLFASEALLIIAALGFLGIGVQPPAPEWGTMLSEGRADFHAAPHVMIFPGLAIALLILGFNLVGDGLRDAIDTRS